MTLSSLGCCFFLGGGVGAPATTCLSDVVYTESESEWKMGEKLSLLTGEQLSSKAQASVMSCPGRG